MESRVTKLESRLDGIEKLLKQLLLRTNNSDLGYLLSPRNSHRQNDPPSTCRSHENHDFPHSLHHRHHLHTGGYGDNDEDENNRYVSSAHAHYARDSNNKRSKSTANSKSTSKASLASNHHHKQHSPPVSAKRQGWTQSTQQRLQMDNTSQRHNYNDVRDHHSIEDLEDLDGVDDIDGMGDFANTAQPRPATASSSSSPPSRPRSGQPWYMRASASNKPYTTFGDDGDDDEETGVTRKPHMKKLNFANLHMNEHTAASSSSHLSHNKNKARNASSSIFAGLDSLDASACHKSNHNSRKSHDGHTQQNEKRDGRPGSSHRGSSHSQQSSHSQKQSQTHTQHHNRNYNRAPTITTRAWKDVNNSNNTSHHLHTNDDSHDRDRPSSAQRHLEQHNLHDSYSPAQCRQLHKSLQLICHSNTSNTMSGNNYNGQNAKSFSRFIESAELTLQSIKAAAQSAPQTRDFLLDINILRPICEMSHAKTHPRILRLCAQILSVLATGFDASSSSLSRKDLADCVLQSVRALAVYLRLYDVSLIKHSCQALAAIAADEEPFTNIQTIIDSGLCRRLIDLLGHQDAIICKHALRVIGNLASGAENQKQYLFNTNTFHSLSSLLRSPNEMIIANVCWVLLNVLDASSASSQASSHRNYTSSSASAFASQYVKYILAQHMLAPLLTLNKQIDVSMRSWSGRVLCGMVLVSRPALINTLINQHDLMNVFLDHLVNDPPTPSFTSSSQQQCYYLFVCALLEAINSVLNKHRSHQAHQASSSSSRDRKKFGPSIAHHTYDRANTGSPAGGGGGYGFNDDDDTAVVLSRPLQIRVGQSAEAMCQLRAFYSDRLQQGGKGMQLIRRIVRLIDVLLANHVQQ